MKIMLFEPQYRDDLIFMILQAKDALGRPPRLNEDLLDIQASYFDRGGLFWIAVDDNDRVVGSIGVQRELNGMRLKRLFVKFDLKRQGIGSGLLEHAERFAREAKAQTIRAGVGGSEYFESHSFYPKHGYSQIEPGLMVKQLCP